MTTSVSAVETIMPPTIASAIGRWSSAPGPMAKAGGSAPAIVAVEADRKLTVACVSKLYPMRSHTVSAEGGAAGVARDDDNLDLHAYDTLKSSDFLADQDCVEVFVEATPKELVQLEH